MTSDGGMGSLELCLKDVKPVFKLPLLLRFFAGAHQSGTCSGWRVLSELAAALRRWLIELFRSG